MLVTTGGLALAGIAGTAIDARSGPVSSALTKRGDRTHEAKLKFEELAWEEKREALIAVIKNVSDIRTHARQSLHGSRKA
jgi:hypothetical protein